jgi:hypothetical protein
MVNVGNWSWSMLVVTNYLWVRIQSIVVEETVNMLKIAVSQLEYQTDNQTSNSSNSYAD